MTTTTDNRTGYILDSDLTRLRQVRYAYQSRQADIRGQGQDVGRRIIFRSRLLIEGEELVAFVGTWTDPLATHNASRDGILVVDKQRRDGNFRWVELRPLEHLQQLVLGEDKK